jgi:DNA-binding GntR family transcriptional regulator
VWTGASVRKKRLTTQEIYQDLWQQIISFDIFPGSRVTETELADVYRTSRTPVREALKRLEAEGLVTIRPKQGCYVRNVDIELISDYYTVRVALEAMAVELACDHMSDDEIEKLAQQWDPQNYNEVQVGSYDIKRHEEAFHVAIARASNNRILLAYLEDVNNRIRPIRLLGFPDSKSVIDTYAEHFEICKLIQQRNKHAAREAMTEHIRKSQGIARTVTLGQLEQYRKKRRLG